MEKVVFSKENDQVIQQNNHFLQGHYKMGNTSGDFNSLERAKESLGILPSVEDNNKLIAVFMGYTLLIVAGTLNTTLRRCNNNTLQT
jgi:hypothetical protein